MAVYKVTFFLQADIRGWTESFGNSLGTIPQITSAALTWAGLRQSLLPNNVSIIGARISDITTFRSAQAIQSPFFPAAGSIPTVSGQNVSNDALGVKIDAAAPPAHRVFLMRNIPPFISTGNVYTPTPGWTFAFNTFTTNLSTATQGWAVLGRTIQGARFRNGQQISAAGVIGYAENLPFVIASTTYCAVHRVSGIAPWGNRVFKLVSQDLVGKTITIRGWPPRPMFSGNPTFTVFDYIAAPIVAAVPDFIRSRKTGRPFGLIRGRRSPQR